MFNAKAPIMFNRSFVIAPLLALGVTAASAVSGAFPAAAETAMMQSNATHVVTPSGRVRRVVKNAADCAPSQARPVWAAGATQGAPIGFRCTNNANGG